MKNNGFLIKLPKKNQDLRADLPTIGFDTIKECKRIGLKGIVLKNNQHIILDKKKIRFSGIDAPESFFRGKKQTCKLVTQKIFCGEISKKKRTGFNTNCVFQTETHGI